LPSLLELCDITKSFGAVDVLQGVNLHVSDGEVLALVGDNGAGKSTTIRTIAGAGPADHGRITFDGRPVVIDSPKVASSLGIATVYQDLALCDNLSVAANLFLGREPARTGAGWAGWLDERAMQARAAELLSTLSVSLDDVRRPVASLSGGQRQSVAIARALLGAPRLVILDEPTAALGVAQTAEVLHLISRLRSQGHAVILISHNLDDVLAVADRVSVLRLGRNNGEFTVGAGTREAVVAAITGATRLPTETHRATGASA
jgi:D-xylose transport system ATP-binding protein